MKTFLVMTLLLLPPVALGQNSDITRLQSTCLPTAPLSTLRAVVQVESSGDPNAMQIDFPKALLTGHYLRSLGLFIVGVGESRGYKQLAESAAESLAGDAEGLGRMDLVPPGVLHHQR